MAKATKAKQIFLVTENEVGTLGKITDVLASKGVNIQALAAYTGKEGKANFHIVTDNNEMAVKAIKERGYEDIKEQDVLVVEFENKAGTLAPIAKKLGDDGVDINAIYGTSADGTKVIGVLSTADDEKALRVING